MSEKPQVKPKGKIFFSVCLCLFLLIVISKVVIDFNTNEKYEVESWQIIISQFLLIMSAIYFYRHRNLYYTFGLVLLLIGSLFFLIDVIG